MLKFESAPNGDQPELTPSERGADVSDAQAPEGELTQEDLEEVEAAQVQEQGEGKPELSREAQIENLGGEVEDRQQKVARLAESVQGTRTQLDEARGELGLPATEEDPPSVLSEEDELARLRAEQEILAKQKEELISQQEKERLIREEKAKILQEKLDELFKEFEGFNPRDLESILKSGRTRDGRNVESPSMGELEPETAKSLTKAFQQGVKLLPKILEALPDLLKKFDEELTKEATERVEQRLEEEKQKMEKEQEGEKKREEPEPGEEPEVPESEVPPGETTQGPASVEGTNVEDTK